MATSLEALPAEMLLRICDYAPIFGHQLTPRRLCYETLRLVSKSINEKITRSYGQEWAKDKCVLLHETGLGYLQATSRGPLAYHVESITVVTKPLVVNETIDYTSDSSDDALHESWYASGRQPFGEESDMNRFNDDVFKFILEGQCAKLLGAALPGLPNLRSLRIIAPVNTMYMKPEKSVEVLERWSMAVRMILPILLLKAVPLESLIIGNRLTDSPVFGSALEPLALYASGLEALKKLRLNIVESNSPVETLHYAKVLISILKNASRLEYLEIGFAWSPLCCRIFKQVARSAQPLTLRRLHLYQLTTRKKYIKQLLWSTRETLEALTLDTISMDQGWDIAKVLLDHFLKTLKQVKLRYINVSGEGLYFDKISLQRPYFRGIDWPMDKSPVPTWDDEWVEVELDVWPRHKIELKHEDGDDLRHWLKAVHLEPTWGEVWTWDDLD